MFRQTPHRPTLASLPEPLPDSWCMRNEGPGRVWWRMPQPASRHSLYGNGCKAAFFFYRPPGQVCKNLITTPVTHSVIPGHIP